VARRGYAAVLDRKDPNWREAGVRALCGALAAAAARHGHGIEVLPSSPLAHPAREKIRVTPNSPLLATARALCHPPHRLGRSFTPPPPRTSSTLWRASSAARRRRTVPWPASRRSQRPTAPPSARSGPVRRHAPHAVWTLRRPAPPPHHAARTLPRAPLPRHAFPPRAHRCSWAAPGPLSVQRARRVRTAAGALNNAQYVRRCVEAAAAAEARADAAHPDKAAAREARQLLERSLEDAPGLPCFSYATGHASPASVVAALRGRGFAAARSAYDGDASKLGSSRRVRTDAPAAVFAEVLEQVVRPAQA
jgi:hypothetical protein